MAKRETLPALTKLGYGTLPQFPSSPPLPWPAPEKV
jgi:hypothetical protein